MYFTKCVIKRELNINELREVLLLMETQETTDRYVSTEMVINGDYAKIEVAIDEDGNVEVI